MPGRKLTKPKYGNGILLAVPGTVAKPQRMMRMARAGGPRGIDERVVKVLLYILDDLVSCNAPFEIVERDSREAADLVVVFGTDRGEDIASE
jgi:hypothetical protein